MVLEDIFRFFEKRMPATQGADGRLRRSITIEGWSKLREDLTTFVKRSGGVQISHPSIETRRSLTPTETEEKPDEEEETIIPAAEFNGIFFPNIDDIPETPFESPVP